MSLRVRLVASLAALFAVGLVVYAVGTYRAFATAELQRLDDQLVDTLAVVGPELAARVDGEARFPLLRRRFGPGGRGAGGPEVIAPGTYAELRIGGRVVGPALQAIDDGEQPDVAAVDPGPDGSRLTTVAAVDGDGRWRVLARTVGDDATVVVAVPLAQVEDSLSGLLAIEVLAGAVLLAVLGLGAWLLLRRGLRPLEQIAATAGSITAGDLDRRVPHADQADEVGALAVALNRMLDELEGAFHERDRTEARLRRFLADASHELRTPLTSIRGFAELFRLGADSPHVDLATTMRRIEEESERMGVLVEDLLTLARLDEMRAPVRADVDLAVLAADACSDAVAMAPDRPVALDAPDGLVVTADEVQLRQALANLVANALQHTPAGTPLDVRVARDGDDAVLSVRDHGPGLDVGHLDHVFDRFWQADAARVGTGAGLGLSIVASVARAHGGSVAAANAPGRGAVFTLRLPVDGPPPAPPAT